MRNLASIQKISNLEFIQNADAIEKATVLGWQLVKNRISFKSVNPEFLLKYGE